MVLYSFVAEITVKCNPFYRKINRRKVDAENTVFPMLERVARMIKQQSSSVIKGLAAHGKQAVLRRPISDKRKFTRD